MIEQLRQYQIEYLNIIKEFSKQGRKYEEYLLLFDKIEILLKKNKKSILNFLGFNNNYVYYGGATYFTKNSKEILPILFANKKVIVADPLMKMFQFLKIPEHFNFDRIKEIIDHAIQNTIELEEKMLEVQIIYINPFDFIKPIKEDIFNMANILTLQYLNTNLNVNYESLDAFISSNYKYSFEELEKEFPKLNQYFIMVNSDIDVPLREKIETNYKDCGIDKENMKDISAIEQVVNTFIGLFGQAFELKSISLILQSPLYVTRPNVLIYLNCINRVDEHDERMFKETNILFALYQVLKNKDLNFNGETECYYKQLINDLLNEKESIDFYVNYIEKYILDKNIT